MSKLLSFIIAILTPLIFMQAQDSKLTGKVMGTFYSVDYKTNGKTTTVNTKSEAFDGNLDTYFASYNSSFTWVGLDLGEPHVITRIAYAPRQSMEGTERLLLGVFQGANNEDFSDALPLYMITETPELGKLTYADVSSSKGFRYVRYVSTRNGRCSIAEIEFYGHKGEGYEKGLYQPTNLPLVVVNTPGMEWFHYDDKNYAMEGSQIYVIDNGEFDVAATGQIRGRGNASWAFAKKPFRIKFDKKQKVLGGPAKAKKWTMINNYGDKTLMRNMLAFEISRRIGMEFTPQCHPVDLIYNGEYQGCYQLCDQIEVNENRVNIEEMKATDTSGEALTGGYLIEVDAYAYQEPADEWFTSLGGNNVPVTIKSPDPGVKEQYNYIRAFFSDMERAVFSVNATNETKGYRKYLDIDSFLRHFIVGELSGNTDTYWSVYMYKDRGDSRLHVGPVWDFDIAFDNDIRTYPINDKNKYIFYSGSLANGMYPLVQRIVSTDKKAKERLSYLWSYAREMQGLDAETFSDIIDKYSELLDQSQKLNFIRWPIMNTLTQQNPRIWGSYEAEVENVRNYLTARFDKLDTLIGRVDVDGITDIEEDATEISVGGHMVSIRCSESYTIYNMQGVTIDQGTGDAEIELPSGLYLIKADKAVRKISI